MTPETLNRVLAELPSYAEIELEFDSGKVHRLMARDLPGADRRFTNLTSGFEWFLPLNVANLGLVAVKLPDQFLGVQP